MATMKRDPTVWLDKINTHKSSTEWNRKKAIICDLDGTLAFPTDRSFYEEEKCKNDILNFPVANVLSMYKDTGYTIIFTSGRQEKGREATINWLSTHLVNMFIGHKHKLYMRRDGDMRDDTVVKKEIYDSYIKDNYHVEAVFDDRVKVVRMWESLGLFVFNCNQGNVEF